ncbi:MAG: ABC transporter ATP-binding protein [Alphaproteobacteria bacterium]|nr:ABC transporter ATP-binding protein [Alphaproteobacteria bacterium]
MIPPTSSILAVNKLEKRFPIRNDFGWRKGWLRALDNVTFDVRDGEVLGLVGESGSGKSTLGKTVMGIHRPTAGTVHLMGQEISGLSTRQHRAVRRHLQYTYQDPGASLDPRWRIRRSLLEPLVTHTDLPASAREEAVERVISAVGLLPSHLDVYPHELSGGQQRRAGLARVLVLQPKVLILDEPTSGLDVSVQATILRLIAELKATLNLCIVFISHDLAVIRLMCDRTAVMYLGRIVEIGATEALFNNPRHPYSQSLLSAVPQIGIRRVTDEFSLRGEPPDPGKPMEGCRFLSRCVHAMEMCRQREPDLKPLAGATAAACHLL